MARKGTWWRRNVSKDEVFSRKSEAAVLSRKTVPEPVTVAHRSGDLTGSVGRVAVAREKSTREVGWEEARHLLDVP